MNLEVVTRIPIVKRLVPAARKIFHLAFEPRFKVYRRYGLLFLLDYRNLVDRNMIIRFGWDGLQYDRLMNLCRELRSPSQKVRFLDIGSHWGLYAIRAAESGMFDSVHAFEPDRRNLEQFAANRLLNDLSTAIDVRNLALSDRAGSLRFALGPEGNRGVSRAAGDKSPHLPELVEVDCERLDSVFPFNGDFLVCKIDVEGHEMEVLEGMDGLWANNRFVIQIESHDRAAAVRQYLEGKGFAYRGKCGRVEQDYFFTKAEIG